MGRTTKPLTATEINSAKPKDKEYNLGDGNGLALRVRPSGSKLWIFTYYQPYTSKRLSMSFGTYPELSLSEARKLRDKSRTLLAKDIDPHEQRLKTRVSQRAAYSNTFESVATNWMEIKRQTVTKDYAEDVWNSLSNHVLPSLGKLPIHKIEAVTTIDVLKPLANAGKLEMVKRICQRLNEIMIYSVNGGLISANPLAGIGKVFIAPKKKNMPSIPPDELPKLMASIANASIKFTTRRLIEWQLHTMTRPSEAAGTRWDEIDLENKIWNIPKERMKKNRPHSIPLSPQAMKILSLMKPISDKREFVFPADRNPSKSANEQSVNMALSRMGYKGILVAHGLRSLASTTLNEHAFDPDLIETALAHVDKNEVRRAYNRAEYIEQRRVMMCWWSDQIGGEENHSK